MNNLLINKTLRNEKRRSIKSLIRVKTIALLTLVVISNQSVYASEPTKMAVDDTPFLMVEKGGQHKKLKKMFKALQLDTTQKAEIKALRKSAKVQNKALFDSLKQYHAELSVLTQASLFDEQAVTNLRNAYQDNLGQAALAKAKTHHAILQVLSEEQRSKWLSLMAAHKTKKGKRQYSE